MKGLIVLGLFALIICVSTQKTCLNTNQTLADPKNCKRFYICQDGFMKQSVCPFSFVYNCMMKTCAISVYKDCCNEDPAMESYRKYKSCVIQGSKVSDPANCHKYFECVNKNVEHHSCPDGQVFDFNSLNCLPEKDGFCITV